jgi:hypothetical protein
MFKRALIVAAALFLVACNSGPNLSSTNTVGGADVVASTQAPMATATTSLSLDWGKKAQAGQVAIADVLSYGGSKVTITAPDGWQKIRDDSTATTRQSLYWHPIQANDNCRSRMKDDHLRRHRLREYSPNQSQLICQQQLGGHCTQHLRGKDLAQVSFSETSSMPRTQ